MPLCDPSEREERAARSARSEKLEQSVHAHGEARLACLPRAARHIRRERGDLEILLDIDREVVTNARALCGHDGRRKGAKGQNESIKYSV